MIKIVETFAKLHQNLLKQLKKVSKTEIGVVWSFIEVVGSGHVKTAEFGF